jgi:hypothetical protein
LANRDWRKFYRDIDEELEELRRASQDYEERQRAMRKRGKAASGSPGRSSHGIISRASLAT